jgi:uncharacterized protein (DUF433 family)
VEPSQRDCAVNTIQARPDIHFGKPCVARTRIPVQDILELVCDGVPAEAIVRDFYPDLKIEAIKACVQYAIDLVASKGVHKA